jgi:hypothetical protein
VGYLDLGDALVLVPGGLQRLRTQLLDAISDDGWDRACSGFGEAELATE